LIILVLSQFLGLLGAGTARLVTTAIIADNRRERENTNKEKCDNPLHQDGHIKGSDIRPSKFMELRAMSHLGTVGHGSVGLFLKHRLDTIRRNQQLVVRDSMSIYSSNPEPACGGLYD